MVKIINVSELNYEMTLDDFITQLNQMIINATQKEFKRHIIIDIPQVIMDRVGWDTLSNIISDAGYTIRYSPTATTCTGWKISW